MKEQKIKLVLVSKEENPELKDLVSFLNQIAKTYDTSLAAFQAQKTGKPLKDVRGEKLGECKVVSFNKNTPITIILSFVFNIHISKEFLIPFFILKRVSNPIFYSNFWGKFRQNKKSF